MEQIKELYEVYNKITRYLSTICLDPNKYEECIHLLEIQDRIQDRIQDLILKQ